MSTDDDDALSWAGDEEPVSGGPRAERPVRTPRRLRQDEADVADEPFVADTPPGDGSASDADPADGGQLGSAALVILGLLGGVHLLYTVGWVVTIAPLQAVFGPSDVLGGALFGLGLAFAAASPIIWFASAFWFTRSHPTWQRIAALVAGGVLLVPWPFVVGVR